MLENLDTRERIMEAAMMVLAERGYSGAGVQEIVKRSASSKGSFYFHFPSKEKMVTALVDRMMEKLVYKVELSIASESTPLDRLVAGIEVLMRTFSEQRKIAQILLLNVMGHGNAMDKKFIPIWERLSGLIRVELDQAVKHQQIRATDTELVSLVWLGALHQVIVRWLVTGQPEPLISCVRELQAILLRSVGVYRDL